MTSVSKLQERDELLANNIEGLERQRSLIRDARSLLQYLTQEAETESVDVDVKGSPSGHYTVVEVRGFIEKVGSLDEIPNIDDWDAHTTKNDNTWRFELQRRVS